MGGLFSETRLNFRALNGPKYRSSGLERILEKYIKGEPHLSTSLTSVIIPAFDTKLQQPVFFSSWRARLDPLENAQVKLVCQATAAAPTYLPPVHFTLTDPNTSAVREFNLIDGGVAVNNPTYVAITQAIKELQSGGTSAGRVEFANYNDLLVLSLGTGQQTVGYTAKEISRWGARDWLIHKGDAPLVDMVYNGSADMVDYNLATIFQSQNCGTNYLRIQSENLKGRVSGVDETSQASLYRLINFAKHLLDEPVSERDFQTGRLTTIQNAGTNREALYRFAEWLSEERKERLAAAAAALPAEEPAPEEAPTEATASAYVAFPHASQTSFYNPSSYSTSTYETSYRGYSSHEYPFESDSYSKPADESSTFDSSYSSSYTKPCDQEYNASYSSYAGPAYESYSSYARPLYESSNSPYEETVHESAFNKSSSYSQPSYKTSVRACAYEQPAYESSISTCYITPPPSYHCSSYSDSEYGQPDWRSEPSYSIPSTPGRSESAYTTSSHKSSTKLPDFLGIFS
ncbi:hypothetical protein CY35_05G127800 [Sphagnum magellanicum]|nr:hypothetical protein CY35_05G127800 [Sphagnum magellanicum]